jgi:phosphoglucosamine mutase
MVLQASVRSGRTLAELLDGVRLYPQTLINVRLKPGEDWRTSSALAERRAEVDRELGSTGRVLIRPSGTEPLVRVMVEAEDAAQARRCAERLAEALG